MSKKSSLLIIFSIIVIASFAFSACGAAAPAEPTADPNAVFTQVAETVMVSMTQTSEAMPPTPMPEPTATTEPTKEVMPDIDMTAEPTAESYSFGPTPTMQRFGDSAQYNTQNPADGKVFAPNENFQFTVCFSNNGSTIWDTTYYLEWMSGYRLWTATKYFYVGESIDPGGKWCFTLPNIAPSEPGAYMTRWYFKNSDGQFMQEVYFNYSVAK
jgi:hypothetical protein